MYSQPAAALASLILAARALVKPGRILYTAANRNVQSMTQTIHDILEVFREDAFHNRDLGDKSNAWLGETRSHKGQQQ